MKKALLFIMALFVSQFIIAQECSELFISEYVEGSGNNKAIEIYNPTDNVIDLSAYQLVRYSNGGTTPNGVALGGTIQPKSTYVVVLDKRDPNGTGQDIMVDLALQAKADTFLCPIYEINKAMYFNGNDAMALEKIGGEAVDIFARAGNPDPENGWTNVTDTTITYNDNGVPTDYTITDYIVGPLFWMSWTRDHSLIRKPQVTEGITENPAVFNVAMQYDSLPENTFENLGSHVCDCNNASVNDLAEASFKFYPNPVSDGQLTIESEEAIESVLIMSITGQVIAEREFGFATFSSTFNINDVESGIYFIKARLTNDQQIVRKFVKE